MSSGPRPSVLYAVSWSGFVRYDAAGQGLVDSRTFAEKPAVGSAIRSGPLPPHSAQNAGDRDSNRYARRTKKLVPLLY